jgi:hypothetical protein
MSDADLTREEVERIGEEAAGIVRDMTDDEIIAAVAREEEEK